MKEVNWNEAPEGTTHYDTEDVTLPWMKLSDGVWYMYTIRGGWDRYEPSENELEYIVERETTITLDPVEDIPLEILDICTAYEQGKTKVLYGKGQEKRTLRHPIINPYSEASAEWFAWGWGYYEGGKNNNE